MKNYQISLDLSGKSDNIWQAVHVEAAGKGMLAIAVKTKTTTEGDRKKLEISQVQAQTLDGKLHKMRVFRKATMDELREINNDRIQNQRNTVLHAYIGAISQEETSDESSFATPQNECILCENGDLFDVKLVSDVETLIFTKICTFRVVW